MIAQSEATKIYELGRQSVLQAKGEPSSPYKEFNRKNNPSAYPKPGEGQQQQQYKMEPGGQLKLPIEGVNRNLMINPQIAHRSHDPSFIHDGIPRYGWGDDSHDPNQHRTPVDDYNNPIPSLKPTDLQIDKKNNRDIDPNLYDDAGMLLSELNKDQLKILKKGIPDNLRDLKPEERLKIMRNVTKAVLEKA